MDPDWSTEEIASLNIAPGSLYPTEGLSWTKVKEILKTNLKSHILADLEREWQQESPDFLLQHMYKRQLVEANRDQPSDAQKTDQHMFDAEDGACLRDLRTTDPREDKNRIEQTKGGLLKDSYRWILEHSDYQQWRNDTQRPLLWIKGDPGKGKTILVYGIIDKVSREKDSHALLSYFFCQAEDMRINNATAVLRGLIYLLIKQQPSLILHVPKRYDQGAKTPFEGVNAWTALSTVFEVILMDMKSQSSAYLIVDALDECDTDLPQLLNLIVEMRLNLELNEKYISRAIEMLIDFRVSQLPLLGGDSSLQEKVREIIYAKANGTFLWVALVLAELELVESWDVLEVLREMPPGLKPLYHRMIQQIDRLQRKDPEFCRYVLSTMILAYRPLHLFEVGALSSLPERISNSPDHVTRVVRKCGSFLTVRGETVFFIHQLKEPGITIDKFKQPDPDPLATVRYSCLYWVDHFLECQTGKDTIKDPKDSGVVYNFLRQYFLYWLEVLSLFKSVSEGVLMIKKLENLQLRSPDLRAFIQDAIRFAVSNLSIIEQAPLQAYCSALVFAPETSIVRKTFEYCIPSWIQRKPKVETHWNAILQILEGHTDVVTSVAFSPDGRQIVSGSEDTTIRRWDAATGQQLLPALEGHTGWVSSVAFSPNGSPYGGHDGNRTMAMLGDAVLKLVLLDDLIPTGASRGFIKATAKSTHGNS
ncbi:hypothetical protein DL98DRAFT_636703 [Cadophora sp. DSE1049]|nr:hypothetical protein DL98DRAFT_636703 [Cadophora sp. DSE1049]